MKNLQLSKIWDTLRSSYWFVPSIMVGMAVMLAFLMLGLDRAGFYGPIEKWGWIYTGGPDGARAVLSTIAGSMVSVTATAFSITIVALQLASSNFGPRLLRNFMQDTGHQIVLGTFISTFIYSLLVLRTVHSSGEGYKEFVPQVAVTTSMVLAIANVGVLIYFIHHASTIIQASHVISEVSDELDDAIERLFPEKIGHGVSGKQQREQIIPQFDSDGFSIQSMGRGYIQGIDEILLMKIACEYDIVVFILNRPGKFVIPGNYLVTISAGETAKKEGEKPDLKLLKKKINRAFILGKERTEQQDIEFPIDQLVEIALRALSPGINDPFTAIRCIDRLSAGLAQLASRKFPSAYRYDEDNNLRVVANPITFAKLTNTAFNQIRQSSATDIAVIIRLLEAIAAISYFTHCPEDKTALLRHADMILRGSCNNFAQGEDQKDIETQYQMVVKALKHNTSNSEDR